MTPTPTPPPNPGTDPVDDRVILAFQETMRAFLDVQRSTMLAYLQRRSSPAASAPAQAPSAAPARLPDPVADRLAAQPPAPTPRIEPVRPAEPIPATAMDGRGFLGADPGIGVQSGAGFAETPGTRAPAHVSVAKGAEAGPAPTGRDAIAARLQEIVRDRTGYPAEMLGLDLDLEADLGIDSIKRVEILGMLRDAIPALGRATDSATMDALSRARTLGAIVDRVAPIARTNGGPATAPAHPAEVVAAPRHDQATPAAEGPVRRMVLEAVPTGPMAGRAGLPPGGVVIVTDDGQGVGRAIATSLEADGHPVELAGPDEVDFASPASISGLLDQARQQGDLAAIVHALPLREVPPAGLDPSAWASRMGPEVKGLFLLAKGAAGDLERAARRGGGALLAATAMGGASASAGPASDFFPGHGGVAGLIKTLAREWPGVRSRVVDLDPREKVDVLATRLLDEFWSEGGWTEVGYVAGERVRLRAVPSPLAGRPIAGVEVRPGEPILLTGGARGITATVAAEVARLWRPTLLLLGRSPLPPEREGPDTAGLAAPAELKAALLDRLRRDGRPSASDLERAYQGVLRSREIRGNVDRLRRAGATVEYAPVDVRDARALADVLDGWRDRFGDPVGLIHGAGVIKDKLIRDKAPDTFDLVLGTKLDGALNLARLLRPEPLRFAALFSSIAGRFGNAGQTDYAAANEVLNKLAVWLDRLWPGRVVAMNWGPWSGVGMVSDLEGHLGGRGLGMITPEVGRGLLLDELRLGRKGEVEVVAAGDLGTLDAPIEVVRPGSNGKKAAGAIR